MQTDNRSFAVAKQAVRQGQQQFRQQLVRAYDGRCAVTGMQTSKVLQAAHILDYRGTQSNAVQNGLLLRSDIHLLFDNYLIGINPSDYRIEVADSIQDPGYAALNGKQLILPTDKAQRPNEQYLAAKYERYRCA